MQKLNALPDTNRADVTPDVLVATHEIGADIRLADKDRNPALPDLNQERVLGNVQVVTGDPRMQGGRYVDPAMDRDSGTYKTGQPDMPLATPGTPHYGCYDASKGHDN